MKEQAEINRVNYSLTKHHREQIRQQIDPNLIDNLELSQHPSSNYKKAFRSVYHDALERTVLDQQLKKQLTKTLLPEEPIRRSLHKDSPSCPPNTQYTNQVSQSPTPFNSLANLKRPFLDYEGEKLRKYDTFVQKQLNEGHSFFKAQDQYLQRKDHEREATRQALHEQLMQKEKQKLWANQEYEKESQAAKENERRMMEIQLMAKQRGKQMRYHLGEDVRRQMEGERQRRHHKSYYRLDLNCRHNPITNPIQYHIDNPYILQKIQKTDLPQSPLR